MKIVVCPSLFIARYILYFCCRANCSVSEIIISDSDIMPLIDEVFSYSQLYNSGLIAGI